MTKKALHISTRVLPGGRVEVVAPELHEGDSVDVVLLAPVSAGTRPSRRSILSFLDALPPGPRSCDSWDEFERQFQQERDTWDR